MRRCRWIVVACITLVFYDVAGAQKQLPEPARSPSRVSRPPISLNVKDATLEDVAKALGDATGKTIVAPGTDAMARRRPEGRPSERYTLNVTEKPFWEVFRQLNEQHAISLTIPRLRNDDGTLPNMYLRLASPLSLTQQHKFLIAGDYWVEMRGAGRNGYQPNIIVSWIVAADPRMTMRVVRATFPPLIHVIDDHGEEMKLFQPQGTASTEASPRGGVWPVNGFLELPKNGAKKITSLQGVVQIEDRIGEDRTIRNVTIPFEFKDIALP